MAKTRHRIGSFAVVILALVGMLASAGCVNKTEVNRARRSLYDTGFARVYNTVLEVVRESYPEINENAAIGKVSTPWRQVQFTNQNSDSSSGRNSATGTFAGGNTNTGLSNTESISNKRYFARFDVTVSGNKPWRVRVKGQASEWRAGDSQPSTLRGAAIPPWLPAREDAMIVAIYRRLKDVAVPAPVEAEAVASVEKLKFNADQFDKVSPEVAEVLLSLRVAVDKRDYPAVRALLAADVNWSDSAAPGVTGAMVVLQADPARLDQLGTALDAGCTGTTEIVCAADNGPTVTLSSVGGRLLVTRFR